MAVGVLPLHLPSVPFPIGHLRLFSVWLPLFLLSAGMEDLDFPISRWSPVLGRFCLSCFRSGERYRRIIFVHVTFWLGLIVVS